MKFERNYESKNGLSSRFGARSSLFQFKIQLLRSLSNFRKVGGVLDSTEVKTGANPLPGESSQFLANSNKKLDEFSQKNFSKSDDQTEPNKGPTS